MSIKRRTQFIDTRNSEVRMYDWNLVGTSKGTMVEPRNMSKLRPGGLPFDPTDECAKVDEFASIDMRRDPLFFGSDKLHGGDQYPRVASY